MATEIKEMDAEKIMEQAGEEVKKKKEQVPNNNEPKNPFMEKLSDNQKYHQYVQNLLGILSQKWDAKGIEPITSHRKIFGPFLIFFKKIIRIILQPVANTILLRQTEFNAQLLNLLSITTERSRQYDNLLKRQEDLEGHFTALFHKVDDRHDELLTDYLTLFKKVDRFHGELGNGHETLFRKVDTWHNELAASHETLFRKVDTWHDELVANFEGMQTDYEQLGQRHIELFQKAMEVRQENILQKQRLDRILHKLRDNYAEPKDKAAALAREKTNLMDHNYFLFENKYRGSEETIQTRQELYLPMFEQAENVLDIGCGRGEFLELLQQKGVKATGIDVNEDMVYLCKEKNLDVKQADAFTYLETIKNCSLGGIFASHVIEHLNKDLLTEFTALCYSKLKPGAWIVLETPNPLSLVVSATNFFLDLSHNKPIHPEAIKFLLESIGFSDLEVKYLSPFPGEMKLQLIKDYEKGASDHKNASTELINKNIEKLNNLLFGFQDFSVIGQK